MKGNIHEIPDFDFDCEYCGENFGSEPIDLAKHIAQFHDPPRNGTMNEKDQSAK